MAQLITIRLNRHDAQPWGFRLQGGKDFGTPLVVQKVNGGSIAENAGLMAGDAVIKVNNIEVYNLRHKDAQDIVVRAGNNFDITVQRGGSTWRPLVTPTGTIPSPIPHLNNNISNVTKTSLVHRQPETQHIGCGYNNAARPFNGVNGNDGHVKSIVNKQYNTPVGIYSEEAIAETLSAQAEVLAGGVLGVNFKKNEKIYNAANSEVLKMLHEQESDPSEPVEKPYNNHSPTSYQHSHAIPVTKHVTAPVDRPQLNGNGGLPAGQNICTECERLIVGVFVRIKDKNLHIDCFKCATCGTSLKNQGYFNLNNKLYCDIHAKLAAMNNPPPGTEGCVPIALKPNQKISASTISAALNAHSVHSNGTTHLIASPTNTHDCEPGVALITSSQLLSASHSRQSSSSSSISTTTSSYSCLSSLSPHKSSSPEKLSPAHSRKSSESGLELGTNTIKSTKQYLTPLSNQMAMIYNNESIVNQMQNENDMNTTNCNGNKINGEDRNNLRKENLNKTNKNTTDNQFLASDRNDTRNNTESIYGTIRSHNKIHQNEPFEYKTLNGGIFRSVIPPGKGIKTTYKLNSNYTAPKPFNSSPMSPPISNPKSPNFYPPQVQTQNWAHTNSTPKQPMNPYATLPRSGGQTQALEVFSENGYQENSQTYEQPFQSHHEIQERNVQNNDKYYSQKEKQIFEEKHAYQSYQEQNYSEHRSVYEDLEVEKANHIQSHTFVWPPPSELGHCTPTASPLYIPPPGTQHIIPKNTTTIDNNQLQISSTHHQSRSAPELSSSQTKQNFDLEQSSDSYTSTCTTTTNTSDEYQRMYQAQTQNLYEQYGSESDYHMDMEVAAMHQNHISNEQYSTQSERKSAQECADMISGQLNTYQLIDLVREATPKTETSPPKFTKKVEFAVKSAEERDAKQYDIEEEFQKADIAAIPRRFTSTPEIVIEIPSSKPIPPSNIPNPIPKEWISPMVRALTTIPDKPNAKSEAKFCQEFYKTNECFKDCDKVSNSQENMKNCDNFLNESPAKGSFITKVMSTAPADSVKFASHPGDFIPLPDETDAYMPPPIDMTPYEREELRPKSPLLNALITAPANPYNSFGHDVSSQLDDLPTPTQKLSMVDALTYASNRSYTPLNSENVYSMQFSEETHKQQEYNLETEIDQQLSAFANLNGSRAFEPKTESLCLNTKTQTNSERRFQQFQDHTQINSEHCFQHMQQDIKITSQECSQQSQKQEKIQTSLGQSFKQLDCQSFNKICSQASNSYHNISQSQIMQTKKNETQKLPEQHQKSQDFENKLIFPPPPGPLAKKTLISGLHKPDNIPQYQRNWTVLSSQRPVRTPEPPELRENVPLAFLEVPKTPSPNVDKQMASKYENAASNLKDKTVPIIIEEHTEGLTNNFQSVNSGKHQDYNQTQPRPHTPSLINKPAPIIPFYQQPEKLVFEECEARKSQEFDPRSPSPCPDRSKSPAPGPPPNPLSAIRGSIAKDGQNSSFRSQQTGSITTGQSYLSTQNWQEQQRAHFQKHQELQRQQQDAQVISLSQQKQITNKPEVVEKKQIGDMTIQTRANESQLNEGKRAELQSKTTTQIGNTQVERRRRVVEEFEHSQTEKTIEIQKTTGISGRRGSGGKTGFVTSQARRLSGLEQEISSVAVQAQSISARAASLGLTKQTSFPQYSSGDSDIKFPVTSQPHHESKRSNSVDFSNGNNNIVFPPPGFAGEKLPTKFSAVTSANTKISSSNEYSLASNNTKANPAPAYKPPSTPNVTFKEQLSTNTNNNILATQARKNSTQQPSNTNPSVVVSDPSPASAGSNKGGAFGATSIPKRGRGILNKAVGPGVRTPHCACCNGQIRGPFITALGKIWCPEHFVCVNGNCRRQLQDIGFVEEKGDLYCEYCFEKYLAPTCSKCNIKIKGDCLNAIGKHYHPECFTCAYCGKLFGNRPFFLEEGEPYCETDWNELFTTKCFACGFPVEAGDRWVEALSHNYHSQCFNCTMCKKNLEGQSFYNKGGRPFCKNHAR